MFLSVEPHLCAWFGIITTKELVMPFSFLMPDRRFRPAGQVNWLPPWLERARPQIDQDIIRSISRGYPEFAIPATPVVPEVMPLDPYGLGQNLGAPKHFSSPASPRQGRPLSYEEFFHQCLTADEIQEVLNDIDIEFQPGSGAEHLVKNRRLVGPVDCNILNENGLTTLAATIKIFQLMNWLPFDSPVPIIGNPYNWIKNARSFFTGTKFRIFRNKQSVSAASAFEVDLILYRAIDHFSLIDLAQAAIHEMRHTIPGGGKIHTCNSAFTQSAKGSSGDLLDPSFFWRNDQDLGDGACAFSYWFIVWCRHHTPTIAWSDIIKRIMDISIDFMWRTSFCYRFGQFDPAKAGPPPIDPLQVYPKGLTYWNDKGQAVPWMAAAGDPLFGSTMRNEPMRTTATYGVPMAPYGLDAWWLYPERRNAVAAQWGTTWEAMRGSVLTI